MRSISLRGIAIRFVIAFGMVTLTWNPSPYNFVRWALNNWSEMMPVVLLVALALLIGWVIFLRATVRSLGPIGIVLAVALAGSVLWVIVDYGLISVENRTTLGWVLLTLFAAILSAGMSWSHLRRRWSGQADMDDVDEVG